MQKDYLVVITVIVLFIAFAVFMLTGPQQKEEKKSQIQQNTNTFTPPAEIQEVVYKDKIKVADVRQGDTISSPLTISGEARGNWFFEATFPIMIVNWDGLIIAQHYAEASGDWMTTDYVPYTSTISFPSPYSPGDPEFMKHGAIILQKDNPSGLPENDDAFEIPILFE